MESDRFIRRKVYQNLSVQPEPPGYQGKVAWLVQQQIAHTNGKHFAGTVGKLEEYPIPDMEVADATPGQLLLDIGCGWGRWLASSAQKGYIPIGIDLKLEFCKTARTVLSDLHLDGYTVVSDLSRLPFKDNLFDVVWSFSVLQHTHREKLLKCIETISRILRQGGRCILQFPNQNGLRNRFGPARRRLPQSESHESWIVRYYSLDEYRSLFASHFNDVSIFTHSLIGIGIIPSDWKFARGFRYRAGIAACLLLNQMANVFGGLREIADSVYIECTRTRAAKDNAAIADFLSLHRKDPRNNLNVVPLLQCPISGGPLAIDETGTRILSPSAKVYFPVVDAIPILIASEAIALP